VIEIIFVENNDKTSTGIMESKFLKSGYRRSKTQNETGTTTTTTTTALNLT